MKTSIHQDQRGLAHIALIAIIVVVIGAVGFAAYRVTNKDSKPTSSLTSQEIKEIEDECKKEIDDKDFCKFASSFSGAENYTTIMETSGANGSSKTTLKTDGDNSSMVTESDGTIAAEYITIGNTSYMKDLTDNQWTKYTSETSVTEDVKEDIDIDFDESDVPEAERTEYKKLGKEACGKFTCFKYQILDKTDTENEQFIWFDDDDYLLRKWTFSGGEGTTTASFSYDKVSISAPSPVKEATSPMDGPSEEELQRLMEEYGQ